MTVGTADPARSTNDQPPLLWAPGPVRGSAPADPTGCRRCGVVLASSPRPVVASPEDAAALLVPRLAGRDREACVVLALDTRHRLVADVLVSVGSVDHTFVAPREVLRDVLLVNGAAMVVGHNHPSGDPTPSADDEAVTNRLARAAEVVGIRLLDHLVVGGTAWSSMARAGLCAGAGR